MTHLLDTNVCVKHLRSGGQSAVSTRFLNAPPGSLAVGSVVSEELLFGAHRSKNVQLNLRAVWKFLAGLPCIPFHERSADATAKIRADLEQHGMRSGYNDFLIAGIALANGLTLVPHNTAEFSRVSGLQLEDWEA